jgi:MscS family membrane protein
MLALAKQNAGEPNLMQEATETLSQTAQSVQETAHTVIPAELREPQWGGIGLLDLGLALSVVAGALLLRWLVLWSLDLSLGLLLRRRASELVQRIFDGCLRLLGFAIFLGGLFFAFSLLDLPSRPVDWAGGIWRFYNSLLVIFAAMLAYRGVDVMLRLSYRPLQRGTALGDRDTGLLRKELAPLLRDLAKVAAVVLATILVVQSWGYSATALLAGVGIGGLALAFAAQDTVANVFGSLVIYTDRPYRTGDWVQIGGGEGVGEEIGIRSTRIRKFDRSVVSVPNKAVTSENIQNYTAMHRRRIRFQLRLDPATEPAKIGAALQALRQLVEQHPRIEQDYWVVNLETLSPASLDILVYCFTAELDWREYLRIQEQLMLAALDALAGLGLSLAQPLLSTATAAGE